MIPKQFLFLFFLFLALPFVSAIPTQTNDIPMVHDGVDIAIIDTYVYQIDDFFNEFDSMFIDFDNDYPLFYATGVEYNLTNDPSNYQWYCYTDSYESRLFTSCLIDNSTGHFFNITMHDRNGFMDFTPRITVWNETVGQNTNATDTFNVRFGWDNAPLKRSEPPIDITLKGTQQYYFFPDGYFFGVHGIEITDPENDSIVLEISATDPLDLSVSAVTETRVCTNGGYVDIHLLRGNQANGIGENLTLSPMQYAIVLDADQCSDGFFLLYRMFSHFDVDENGGYFYINTYETVPVGGYYNRTTGDTLTARFIDSIPNFNIVDGDLKQFYLGTYADNFMYTTVRWSDSNGSYNITRALGSGETCGGVDYRICVKSSANNFLYSLKSQGNGYNGTEQVYLEMGNSFSKDDVTFDLNFYGSQDYEYISTRESNSFITYLSGFLANTFPSSDSMSLSYKLAHVFITIGLVSLVLLFMFATVTGSMAIGGIVVGVVDLLLLMYFIAIGYIPLVVLVILFLILSVLAWLKGVL